MDVELFRLLLLIIGILFLLGIYFWDRHKRINEEIILNRRAVERASSKGQKNRKVEEPADAPQDWDDDEDLDDDFYTPSGQTTATKAPGRAQDEGFLGLLKREGRDMAEVSQRQRQEPSLIIPESRSDSEHAEAAVIEPEPAPEPDDLPEIVSRDTQPRQEPWLADLHRAEETPAQIDPVESQQQPSWSPAAEDAVDAEQQSQSAPVVSVDEAEIEVETEHEGQQSLQVEANTPSKPSDSPLADAAELETVLPVFKLPADPADVPEESAASLFRDTEAEDLHSEPDEAEPLEPLAAPSRASIEPAEVEPILAPLPKDLPHKLVQISLVARGAFLEGTEILDAVRALKLTASRMQAFHRVDPSNNEIIYSVASMVEPGTFPLQDMSDFASPGLTFFMQLPCSVHGPEAFDEMLATAQRMAELLNAEMQDQSHRLLSRQAIEHIRSEVQEHARQVRLALSRRGRR